MKKKVKFLVKDMLQKELSMSISNKKFQDRAKKKDQNTAPIVTNVDSTRVIEKEKKLK